MFADPKAAAERLKALAKLYGAELPGKLDELEALARQLSGAEPLDEARRRMVKASELAHKIAGTAGSFGYPEVTNGTRAIEESLRTVLEAGRPLTAEQAARIISEVEKLKKLSAGTPGR